MATKYSPLSDFELQELLRCGDQSAYTEIYDRYHRLLHSHAYKKLNDREEAKDVVQGVFLMLWTKRESLDIQTNLAGYLYTAIRNRVLNIIAQKQVRTKYTLSLEQFMEEGTYSTDYLVRERELAKVIEQEISKLPPKMLEIFQLSRKESLSHKEIAATLQLSEHTVRTQVRNALRILRVRLGILTVLFSLFWT